MSTAQVAALHGYVIHGSRNGPWVLESFGANTTPSCLLRRHAVATTP